MKKNNFGIVEWSVIILFVVVFFGSMAFNISNKDKTIKKEEIVTTDKKESSYIAASEESKNNFKWIINKSIDDMTDTENIWATLKSENYINQDFPYNGETYCTIVLRYMKKYGYDAIIEIDKGQINGREYYGTDYITVRFDKGSPKKYYFNESSDGDSKVVFLRNPRDFIRKCKTAKDIILDIPLYREGRPTFSYHVTELLEWPSI